MTATHRMIGQAPTPSVRVDATVRLTGRQDVRFTYAPIRIAGGGVPRNRDVVLFAGERFEPADTHAEEGGAAVNSVYTFAALNAAVAGATVGF